MADANDTVTLPRADLERVVEVLQRATDDTHLLRCKNEHHPVCVAGRLVLARLEKAVRDG